MNSNELQKISAPPSAAVAPSARPEFIRLPKSGRLCPFTGLSRSKMNELVLPSPFNNFKPQVKSISLRNRGQVKAVRLIVYDSLTTYLRSFLQEGGVLVIAFLFAAFAALAMGHSTILGVKNSQLQPALFAGCNLPLGNTSASQTAIQNANIVGSDNKSVAASGLAGLVAATVVAKLDRASSEIIASSPFPSVWDLRFASLDTKNYPGACATFGPGQAIRQIATKYS
jgi:hypothetical protein